MMTKPFLISAIFAVTALACSPAPAPISTSQRDPSNPNAPEGATPPVTNAAPMPPSQASASAGEHSQHDHAPPATASGHEGHGGAAASSDAGGGGADVTYVCPMHPEVTSTKAGSTCPKCNMKLVPKK